MTVNNHPGGTPSDLPPSIAIIVPVISSAVLLLRNAIVAAISSGVFIRPSALQSGAALMNSEPERHGRGFTQVGVDNAGSGDRARQNRVDANLVRGVTKG